MAFSRPTLKELIDRVKTDITSRLGSGSPLRRSFVNAVSYAVAGCAHLLYGFINWVYKQRFPHLADEENMLEQATFYGIERKQPSFAERDVKFTGTNGAVVPMNTILNRSDGIQFRLLADVTISEGIGSGRVIALVIGQEGNTPTGAKLSLLSPISGVNGQAEVLGTNVLNGEDLESPESVLARLLDKVRMPPHGGSENDYKQWALEVAGVTRAFVYPARMGLGTVGVSFLMDNEEDIIPTSGKVEEVQAYLNERRPVTSEVWVFAPESQTVDFIINLSPNTVAVQQEVENEIRDMFKRIAAPDKVMPISKILESISIAAGEDDHELQSPTGNITPATGKILIPGTFTFNPLT